MTLNKLESSVIRLLWTRPAATSREIHEAIQDKIAYSTLSFCLRMMEIKGIICHKKVENHYSYSAILDMEDFFVQQLKEIRNIYFAGDTELFKNFMSTKVLVRLLD